MAAAVGVGQRQAEGAEFPVQRDAVAPALHHAVGDEAAEVADVGVAVAGLLLRADGVGAGQLEAEATQCRVQAAELGLDVHAAELLAAAVLLLQLDEADGAVVGVVVAAGQALVLVVAVHQGFVLGQVGKDHVVAEGADEVALGDGPVVHRQAAVAGGLKHQADRLLARLLGLELRIGVGAGVPEVGAEAQVVVVLGHADGVGQHGGLAGLDRPVEVVHRGRAEARAGRGAHQQAGRQGPAQAELGRGRAADGLVTIVAQRSAQLQGLADGRHHLGVDRPHAAAAVGGLRIAGRGVADDLVGDQQVRGPALGGFAAQLGAEGHGQFAPVELHQAAPHAALHGPGGTARAAHLLVDLRVAQDLKAGGAARSEGIDGAAVEAGQHRRFAQVAAHVALRHRVGGGQQGHFEVPAGRLTVDAQHGAGAGAGQLAAALAGFEHARARHHVGLVKVGVGAHAGGGQGRDQRHRYIGVDAVAGAGVNRLGAPAGELGKGLQPAAEREHAARQQTQAVGLRVELDVAHEVVGAAVHTADAGRQVERVRRVAVGHAEVDRAVLDHLAVDHEIAVLQVVALRAAEADVGRETGRRQQVRQAQRDLQVADELALRGVERVAGLPVQHCQHVETVAGDVADAEAQRGAALAGAALGGLAGEGVGLQALVVAARDEVHHAADGVRAVGGRGAVEQDLDALDGGGRDVVQVDADVVARRGEVGHAPAVEQHQGGRHTEATQVHGVETHLVAKTAVGHADAVGQVVGRGRQQRHQFGYRGGAALADVLLADHLHRQRGLGVEALDGRAGDLDALEALGGFLGLCLGLCQQSGQGGSKGEGERGKTRHGRLGWLGMSNSRKLRATRS